VLTGAEPGSIGLSSIGAHLPGTDQSTEHGLYLRLGTGGQRVLAPIGPGLIRAITVAECRPLAPDDEVVISQARACVLALDGEREIQLRAGAPASLRFTRHGPRVVDARRALAVAARAGAFLCPEDAPDGFGTAVQAERRSWFS
jgi:hypothetical protein